MSTGIEWTDETWNPTTGCDQVSPGCDNCYALTMAKRLKAMGSAAYQHDGDPRTSGPGFALQVHEDRLDQPLRWTKPRRIFVNSMSDLFHPRVPDEFITRVWDVMEQANHHTFQVLTKRPKRMRAFLVARQQQRQDYADKFDHCPTEAMRNSPAAQWARARAEAPGWPHIWVGTSVEDQQRADERIPALLDTPAAVRFLSMEPLLGPVDLVNMEAEPFHYGLDWVIVGGESGRGARPMDLEWAGDIVDQCTVFGVPVFVKQLGSLAGPDHHDIDQFPPDLQVRQFPKEVAHA